MRKFLRRRLVSAVMGCLIAGLLTSPVLAQVITGEDDSLRYPDVNTAGNLVSGGNRGVAKTFKFTRLNLLTAIATARCTNLSGKPQVYFNTGFPILDPQSSFNYSVGNDVNSITGNQGTSQAFQTILAIATAGSQSN